jgi:hypothetical protein
MNVQKTLLFGVVFFWLVFALSGAYSATKLKLYINGKDADTNDFASAAVVQGIAGNTFTITITVKNNQQVEQQIKPIDLVFVLDASGSMQGEINAVKNSIKEIADKLNEKCQNAGLSDCFRAGLWVIEGRHSGSRVHRRAFDLTFDVDAVKLYLDGLQASGAAEPWADFAINSMRQDSWRNDAGKMIIIITDVKTNNGVKTPNDVVNEAKARDVHVFGIYSNSCEPLGCPKDQLISIANQLGDAAYEYTNTSQIPDKIWDAIQRVISSDDVVLSKEQGPVWDGITGDIEINNVPREGDANYTITLNVPTTFSQTTYFLYKVSLKSDPSVSDHGWLIVLKDNPPSKPTVTITPDPAYTYNDLNCSAVAVDPEGQPLTYTFQWKLNGTNFGSSITQSQNSVTLDSRNTAVGQTWTCEVVVSDGAHISETGSDSVTIVNQKPVLNSVVISPATPYTTEDLVCTAIASDNDPEDVDLDYEFTWLKNGTPVHGPTVLDDAQSVLDSSETAPNETWECRVRATDGKDWSDYGSDNVTVINRPPSDPIVRILPTSPNTNDTLVCQTIPSVDLDNQDVNYKYAWYRNTEVTPLKTEGPTPSLTSWLDSSYTSVGDVIYCKVRAWDGIDDSNVGEDSVTIVNRKPSAPAVLIKPKPAFPGDSLECKGEAVDPDGGIQKYKFTWFKNGSLVDSATIDVDGNVRALPPSVSFNVGDVIKCEVLAYDGYEWSEPGTDEIVIDKNEQYNVLIGVECLNCPLKKGTDANVAVWIVNKSTTSVTLTRVGIMYGDYSDSRSLNEVVPKDGESTRLIFTIPAEYAAKPNYIAVYTDLNFKNKVMHEVGFKTLSYEIKLIASDSNIFVMLLLLTAVCFILWRRGSDKN